VSDPYLLYLANKNMFKPKKKIYKKWREKYQNHTLGTKSNGKSVKRGEKIPIHTYMITDFFGLVVL